MGRAFLEWYPKFTPNIITIHFDFWTVSDKIAATVIIGFIVVKITHALTFRVTCLKWSWDNSIYVAISFPVC
jgi:hypothetical protein